MKRKNTQETERHIYKNQYINILVYLENWPWTTKNAFKIAILLGNGSSLVRDLERK